MRRDAALEVAPQFAFHETRQATTLLRARQECLEMLTHRAVERCPLDATRQRQGGVGSTVRWMVVSRGEGTRDALHAKTRRSSCRGAETGVGQRGQPARPAALGALERGTSLWKAIIEGFVDLIEGLRPARPP